MSVVGDDWLGARMGRYLRDVFAIMDTVPLSQAILTKLALIITVVILMPCQKP